MSTNSDQGFASRPNFITAILGHAIRGQTSVDQRNITGEARSHYRLSCVQVSCQQVHCSQLIIVHQLLIVALHISCRFKAGHRSQVEGAVCVLQLPQVPQVAQLLPQEVRHVLPPLLRQCPITIPVRLQVAGNTHYYYSSEVMLCHMHTTSCNIWQCNSADSRLSRCCRDINTKCSMRMCPTAGQNFRPIFLPGHLQSRSQWPATVTMACTNMRLQILSVMPSASIVHLKGKRVK